MWLTGIARNMYMNYNAREIMTSAMTDSALFLVSFPTNLKYRLSLSYTSLQMKFGIPNILGRLGLVEEDFRTVCM